MAAFPVFRPRGYGIWERPCGRSCPLFVSASPTEPFGRRRYDGEMYLFVYAATTEIGKIEFRLNPTDEEVDAVWQGGLTVHRTGDTLGS